jgi:hypothetical protein
MLTTPRPFSVTRWAGAPSLKNHANTYRRSTDEPIEVVKHRVGRHRGALRLERAELGR